MESNRDRPYTKVKVYQALQKEKKRQEIEKKEKKMHTTSFLIK